MAIILDITDLSYENFENINLSFEEKTYYSIIGSNNCGKTTLLKLIAGIIPSNYAICCNYVDLCDDSIFEYITNIGVVTRFNKDSFICKEVLDEMMYPLTNLGYSKNSSLNRIKEVLNLFDMNYLMNKKISELSYYEKELLLMMIAILHQPKVLLLDSVIEVFSKEIQEKLVNVFKKLIKEGMTIISFTNSLNDAYYSDKIILLDKYRIVGEYTPRDIYKDDKLFYEYNLEIPFLVDLSVKLKMYNLVDKEYLTMKEMVDDIWP